MSAAASPGGAQVRSAELVATLCLATDLGMGFPFEHGLHSTLIAMRLAERLGLGHGEASQTYYACLLFHSGCTTEAHVTPQVFGGSLTTHLHPVIRGSGREVFSGLVRALPDPGSAAGGARAADRPPDAEDGAGAAPAPHRRVRGGGHARRGPGAPALRARPARLL